MKDQKFYAVNWTDGVKITKDHFLASYYNTIDTIRDIAATGLNSYNYGLLKPAKGGLLSLDIETHTHTSERLVLKLQACNAITSKGLRIAFSPEMYGNQFPTATIEATNIDTNSVLDFYVVVTINPFELVPVGEPDPEAIPLHHPDVLPKIGLEIIPKSQFNNYFLEKYFLLVGQVQWKNGSFLLDSNYIPPVKKIVYHTNLNEFYKRICHVLVEMKRYSIIINNKNRSKYQNNKLARNTFALCVKVLDFVSEFQFGFNQIGAEEPPIYIAEKISILANHLSNELALMERSEKEEVLQYYYEWIDIKPSIFESALGEVIEFKYDHLDINKMVVKIDYFMAIINQLWKKLSELEYVGQRKENIVISEENRSIKQPQKNRSWSIID